MDFKICKLRVTNYYLLHELRVNICIRVTSQYLLLRITIYDTCYELLFTYHSQVTNYRMNYEFISISDK